MSGPVARYDEIADFYEQRSGQTVRDPATAALLANVARLLRPGGWFVFSLLHPCFPGWDSDAPSSWPPDRGYYQEGWWLASNTGYRGRVGASHRMISTYLNSLIEHGLTLDRAIEPLPGPEMEQRRPPGAVPVPFYFAARCLLR
jgi:SAM-dependent methyltransferase